MAKTLTIFQQNDSHGCLDMHDEFYWQGSKPVLRKAGGLARINQYVKNVKRQQNNVLFFDSGDLFHGTLPLLKSQGEALIPILKKMEIDGFVPGNWDFAYGKEQLKKLTSELPFPTLACNVRDNDTKKPFFIPYREFQMEGMDVGVIGLTYGYEEQTMPDHFTKGLSFTLGIEEVSHIVQTLRGQVDLIIVVSHLGLPLDVKMASIVKGIDVILSGHSHDRITRPIIADGTIVVQAGSNSAFLGRLDISLESGNISHFEYRLIDIHEGLQEDPDVKDLVKSAVEPFNEEINHLVGKTNTLLHRMTLEQSPMDKLITDAYLHSYDCDIAFSHGWRYGPPIAAGPLSMYDLNSIIPTNPNLFTLEVEGYALRDIMETNLEMVFAADPFEQKGGYILRSSGLAMTYKPYNPRGQRIQTLYVGGKELDNHATYKVVGGGGQLLKGSEKSKTYYDDRAIDVICSFLKDKGSFELNDNNQIISV
ncbi:2',3'-cyclic-nucleotide 2'-phosphodiesterase (5'-nucleotidase family) [Bacillus oleivorans]|uniref:2',3'-cyclic-nucleotide 2'-phosphodiesterase (5'-nucleotidase family) n=1 Tax=Bacillus oleivorans TaxID=1448271 RepID=A0A285D781_9BACI|nr:bifunctional metallophosphatase/5'-nucleotidase [Bacillus oleivorans]SNX75118.1 2',3'-cyclic-nucleotide 2'-phosphodiesterase (5'-nucleotidase family) [Bacillus oleivorans]